MDARRSGVPGSVSPLTTIMGNRWWRGWARIRSMNSNPSMRGMFRSVTTALTAQSALASRRKAS